MRGRIATAAFAGACALVSPLRFLPLCVVLWFAGAAPAADLAREHEALLAGQLSKIERSRPGTPELYLLAAGMSSRQDVFRNDVETVRDLFDRYWNTAGRSVALIADDTTRESYAYPTPANLRRAAEGLAQKLDPQKDVLVLFLTSHGTTRGLAATLPGGSDFNYSPVEIRRLLEATGAKYRVVVLSACHSGALMNDLADENTLVIAAAHGSRASFGCSFIHLHTWFTEAWFEALAADPRFEPAFQAAAARIAQREQGGEAFEHSMPQIRVGSAVRAKLQDIEARAKPAMGWTPPVVSTEAGKVRQITGDYLALGDPAGGDPQVRWLQIRKVDPPENGVHAVSAWAQWYYRSSGDFAATYDPKSRVLAGSSATLGRIQLTLDGDRLNGTHSIGSTTARIEFAKVPRREIYEAAARHPPARLRAGASSVVRLWYLNAPDCVKCLEWEREHLQGGRLAAAPEFRQVDLVTARRASQKTRLRKSDLPDSVAHLYDRLEREKGYAPLLAEVPAFVVLVDDQIRLWRVGPFIDSPIYPVLREALAEKTARP